MLKIQVCSFTSASLPTHSLGLGTQAKPFPAFPAHTPII